MLTPLKIKIIIGSTRQNRFSEKPSQWIFEEVSSYAKASENKEEIGVELLDLRDYQMPFLNDAITPSKAQGNYENEIVKKWATKIKEGDAFIIVAPEYNHGYPGVLKNALDSIFIEWDKKPVGFVSYGGVGGARMVEQLRLVALELGMIPIKTAIHIQQQWNLLDENGNLKPAAFDPFKEKADRFLNQLLWWANLLKSARHETKPS